MRSTRQLVRSLLLTGVMLGLSVLGVVRHYHSHPSSHLSRLHHSLPVQPHSRRASSAGAQVGVGSASSSGHAEIVAFQHIGTGGHHPSFASARPAVGATLPVNVYRGLVVFTPTRYEVPAFATPRTPGEQRGPPQHS